MAFMPHAIALATPMEVGPIFQPSSQTISHAQAQLPKSTPGFDVIVRAIRQSLASDRYHIESKLAIIGNFPGGTFSSQVQIQTLTIAPHQFRSEIAFTDAQGSVGKQYTVVSNGDQVWIYDASQNVYSVMDYKGFIDSDDSFLLGLLSSFLLEFRKGVGNVETLLNLPEDQLIETIEAAFQSELTPQTIGTETLDGMAYTTYSYTDPQQEFTMRVWINSATAEVEQLHLAGEDNGLDIVLRERIIRKTEPQFIPADTFSLCPTLGVNANR